MNIKEIETYIERRNKILEKQDLDALYNLIKDYEGKVYEKGTAEFYKNLSTKDKELMFVNMINLCPQLSKKTKLWAIQTKARYIRT